MAGSSKLDCYGHLITLQSAEVFVADGSSNAFDALGAIRGLVTVRWSGYDATDGKLFLQITDDPANPDVDWEQWGRQGNLNAASGTCIFHIWRGAPGFVRVRFELGTGTTLTVSSTYRFGWG